MESNFSLRSTSSWSWVIELLLAGDAVVYPETSVRSNNLQAPATISAKPSFARDWAVNRLFQSLESWLYSFDKGIEISDLVSLPKNESSNSGYDSKHGYTFHQVQSDQRYSIHFRLHLIWVMLGRSYRSGLALFSEKVSLRSYVCQRLGGQ